MPKKIIKKFQKLTTKEVFQWCEDYATLGPPPNFKKEDIFDDLELKYSSELQYIGLWNKYYYVAPTTNTFEVGMNWDEYHRNRMLRFKYSIEHINEIECWECIENARMTWCRYYKKDYNEYLIKDKQPNFYWVTITGKKRIEDNHDTFRKMKSFCEDLYSNDSYKRFEKVIYNIETGKHEDNPNLHTHALIIFENSTKNFKRDCISRFNKYFKEYGIDIDMKRFAIHLEKIYNDKLNYLNNKDKSILHQNYRDLEILEVVE